MRRLYITVAAVVGLGLTIGGTPAMAGYCGTGPTGPVYKQNCNVPVVMMPGSPAVHDPVLIHTTQPMGHLRSIKYHGAPHVNVTRIHGLPPTVGLGDVPIRFTGGCNPTSTTYCRRPMGHVARPAPAPMPVTYRQQTKIVSATITPPRPAPVMAQPLSIAVAPPPPPRPQPVCRPPAPPKVHVVRPVIGVPVPVPTPLPPIGCFGTGPIAAPVIAAPHYNHNSHINAGLAGAPPSYRFSSAGH